MFRTSIKKKKKEELTVPNLVLTVTFQRSRSVPLLSALIVSLEIAGVWYRFLELDANLCFSFFFNRLPVLMVTDKGKCKCEPQRLKKQKAKQPLPTLTQLHDVLEA